MHELIPSIILLVFFTFWSAFFSASEIALFSLPSTKIKSFQADKNPRHRLIAQLVLKPRDLLVTVFMLNTLVNVLLQNTASSMFGNAASWTLKVGVPLVITLVVGEILPKYIAMQHNISLSYLLAPTVSFFTNVLRPIREFIVAITTPISRLLFFFLKKEKTISKEELLHVLKTSQEFGVLHPDEAEMINGYLELQDEQVKEVMWPKENVLFYNIHDPLTKLTHLFVEEECTRLPVCDKELDHVLGIITADQYFIHQPSLHSPDDLRKILKKPFFVPENTPARLLWRRFDERQEMLALIVDEYGAVSGLITREDLVEEITGEITDRRDQAPLYTWAGDDTIIANGKLELSEFEEIFGIPLYSPNKMITIAGWLIEHLGEIPKSGTKYETAQFFFQILNADPNRIKNVYIRNKEHKKGASQNHA